MNAAASAASLVALRNADGFPAPVSGQRHEIASPVGLPDAFTLVIAADHFLRHCHAVWSADRRIGVAFD